MKIVKEIVFSSRRKDINDFLVNIIKQHTNVVAVIAFEGISFIKAQTFRKCTSVWADMFVKEVGNGRSRHMVFIRNILKGDFRFF